MTSDRRREARRVFMEVADLPAEEQAAALAEACAGDNALRNEVDALLQAEARAGGFMADPTSDAAAALEEIADRVEVTLQDRPEKEISTDEVGAFLMSELKSLDKVAYVRFASVYRHFRDIGEFMTELRGLLDAKD